MQQETDERQEMQRRQGRCQALIVAATTDALALRLLAYALTNPEIALELADTARRQYGAAVTDAALADATLAAYNTRMAEIDAEQNKLITALSALSGVSGM